MKPSIFRETSNHFRRCAFGSAIITALMVVAFAACLLFEHAGLAITFACAAVFFSFLTNILMTDSRNYRELADQMEEFEYDDEP